MKLFSVLLCFLVLTSCSLKAENEMMKTSICEALKRKLKDKDYRNILNESGECSIEKIKSYGLKYDVYKFEPLEPRLSEYQFIFSINNSLGRVFLLTENISNYNALLKTDELSVEKSNLIAMQAVRFTRPFYKLFVVLDTKEKALEYLKDVRLSQFDFSSLKLKRCDVGYCGNLLILLDNDLVSRKVTVSDSGVMFSDKILLKQVGKYIPIH